MKRIWLNHWFSTAYNIIRMIRESDPEYTIIGTNENEESPIRAVCDEWYREPKLKGREYADFCLDFCREHGVDVFMPRREMAAVSREMDRFKDLGVRVMAEKYQYVDLFGRKDLAYAAFREKGIGRVPEFYMVTDTKEFLEAYETLSGRYENVCFKFVRDEGGKSYRLIDNRKRGYASLFKKQTTRISLDEAIGALREKEPFPPVMVMPCLSGDEVSVDCLMTGSGLIAIPRVKDATRIEKIRYDDEILNTCARFYEAFPLEMPCNIQLKYLDGIPYMLEVNTRMSGGVQMSCAAAGVNIPGIAVAKLLGIDMEWKCDRTEKSVTHVEVPVVL